eukprot:CAMPEP_0195074700 /NCGR_PEP_ID=MMETSP0448-20130528/17741_1 /TAXON_ID=66468 /ORGANISM="Heterocapsa triquestra, Strain CCMP 448" /LENGTH=603 /DNA_ID=CAMNT_0040106989 /DNA_START=61 /DNA_END=1869 /DNA_ORIENTATION=-
MRPSNVLAAALAAACAVLAAGEEAEAPVSKLNLGIGVMLLGSIGFMMGLFYLVNHSDKDIKMYSWRVICSTISIFTAVLMFQAVDSVLKAYVLTEAFEAHPVLTNFCISLGWFSVLQVFLAYVSRCLPSPCPSRCFPPLSLEGHEREEGLETIELDMKCWAVLLGHITGFSSIAAWCSLQQQFKDSLMGSLLVLPLAAVLLWCLFNVMNFGREWYIALGDGVKEKTEEMWDDETEETEDDVFGLTLSFLAVQCIRFAVHGRLPNAEGNLPDEFEIPGFEMIVLAVIGTLFAGAIFLRSVMGVGGTEEGRVSDWIRLVCNFVFSWCIMFGIDEYLAKEGLGGESSGAMGKVILAMVITCLAFALIFALDTLADLDSTSAKVDKSIRSLVGALGILVGFSWEDCFDVAVANVAAKVDFIPDAITKLLLSLVLSALVLPAWRWYILPVVLKMEEEWQEGLEGNEEGKEETKEVEAGTYKALPGGDEGGRSHSHDDRSTAENLARELATARVQLRTMEERAIKAEQASEDSAAAPKGGEAAAASALAAQSGQVITELRQKLLDANTRMEQLKTQASSADMEQALQTRGQEINKLQGAVQQAEESAKA